MTATVVVGAGLAGLACARTLHDAGRDVLVLEAADGVGGRVRTDLVDGFLLDRGFQVLLTAYPAVQSQLDVEALDLRPFRAGVKIRTEGRTTTVRDPFRDPLRAVGGLLSPVLTTRDALRLLALRQRVVAVTGEEVATRPQRTAAELLAEDGFSEAVVERFFRPFLGGVFFDRDLRTSSRMVELVFRCFFRGDVAVPARGMGELGDQLARRLPSESLRLSTPVERVEQGAVVTADGERIEAAHVVVATDGPAAAELLGDEIEVAPGLGTVTLWWSASRSPVRGAWLVLDGDRTGPVNNLAVMSDVSPAYAPPGRSLVAGSVVGIPDRSDEQLDGDARRQLRAWYGHQVDAWRLLRVDRIPWAQPRQEPGDLDSLARPVAVRDGVWVCGDHRDTASIQGALVSGRRTAQTLLATAA